MLDQAPDTRVEMQTGVMDLAFRGRYGLEIVDTWNLLEDQEATARQVLVSLDRREKGREAGRTRDLLID